MMGGDIVERNLVLSDAFCFGRRVEGCCQWVCGFRTIYVGHDSILSPSVVNGGFLG